MSVRAASERPTTSTHKPHILADRPRLSPQCRLCGRNNRTVKAGREFPGRAFPPLSARLGQRYRRRELEDDPGPYGQGDVCQPAGLFACLYSRCPFEFAGGAKKPGWQKKAHGRASLAGNSIGPDPPSSPSASLYPSSGELSLPDQAPGSLSATAGHGACKFWLRAFSSLPSKTQRLIHASCLDDDQLPTPGA